MGFVLPGFVFIVALSTLLIYASSYDFVDVESMSIIVFFRKLGSVVTGTFLLLVSYLTGTLIKSLGDHIEKNHANFYYSAFIFKGDLLEKHDSSQVGQDFFTLSEKELNTKLSTNKVLSWIEYYKLARFVLLRSTESSFMTTFQNRYEMNFVLSIGSLVLMLVLILLVVCSFISWYFQISFVTNGNPVIFLIFLVLAFFFFCGTRQNYLKYWSLQGDAAVLEILSRKYSPSIKSDDK